MRDKTLHIYVVPQENLKEYTSDKRRYAYESLPGEQYRVLEEEFTYNSFGQNQESAD